MRKTAAGACSIIGPTFTSQTASLEVDSSWPAIKYTKISIHERLGLATLSLPQKNDLSIDNLSATFREANDIAAVFVSLSFHISYDGLPLRFGILVQKFLTDVPNKIPCTRKGFVRLILLLD